LPPTATKQREQGTVAVGARSSSPLLSSEATTVALDGAALARMRPPPPSRLAAAAAITAPAAAAAAAAAADGDAVMRQASTGSTGAVGIPAAILSGAPLPTSALRLRGAPAAAAPFLPLAALSAAPPPPHRPHPLPVLHPPRGFQPAGGVGACVLAPTLPPAAAPPAAAPQPPAPPAIQILIQSEPLPPLAEIVALARSGDPEGTPAVETLFGSAPSANALRVQLAGDAADAAARSEGGLLPPPISLPAGDGTEALAALLRAFTSRRCREARARLPDVSRIVLAVRMVAGSPMEPTVVAVAVSRSPHGASAAATALAQALRAVSCAAAAAAAAAS